MTACPTEEPDADYPTIKKGSLYLQSCITWALHLQVGWTAHLWMPDKMDPYGLLDTYHPLVLSTRGQTVAKNL